MSTIEKIGIVGFGPMGRLMSEHMLPEAEQEVSDLKIEGSALPLDFMTSDAVLLTVPAENLWGVLKDIVVSPTVKDQWDKVDSTLREEWIDPLLIEPASVKMFPERLLDKIDPDFPEVLHCHPLFGPQSVANGVAGKTVIVTKKRGEKAEELLEFWEKEKGLVVVEMTAEEHDREMAKIQAVTFVLGRLAGRSGLAELVADSPLATHSSSIAGELAKLDLAHSDALFNTIVAFNPFVKREILRLKQVLWQIDSASLSGQLALHAAGLIV